MKTNNAVKDKAFDFALDMISLFKIHQEKKEFIISKQLLRSGTSIGANINEAMAGQSKRDFISKMSIASKESRESGYWLELLDKSQMVQYDYSTHLEKNNELIRLLTAIVKTSQRE